MTDIDDLYADVFQITSEAVKKSPALMRAKQLKSCDENSIDIYSDLDIQCHLGNSAGPLTSADTDQSHFGEVNEISDENIKDDLNMYTDICTSELTEKQMLKQELLKLRTENTYLMGENKQLRTQKEQVLKNISCLFLTAKKELQKKEVEFRNETLKKDAEINKLRVELEILKVNKRETSIHHSSSQQTSLHHSMSYQIKSKDTTAIVKDDSHRRDMKLCDKDIRSDKTSRHQQETDTPAVTSKHQKPHDMSRPSSRSESVATNIPSSRSDEKISSCKETSLQNMDLRHKLSSRHRDSRLKKSPMQSGQNRLNLGALAELGCSDFVRLDKNKVDKIEHSFKTTKGRSSSERQEYNDLPIGQLTSSEKAGKKSSEVHSHHAHHSQRSQTISSQETIHKDECAIKQHTESRCQLSTTQPVVMAKPFVSEQKTSSHQYQQLGTGADVAKVSVVRKDLICNTAILSSDQSSKRKINEDSEDVMTGKTSLSPFKKHKILENGSSNTKILEHGRPAKASSMAICSQTPNVILANETSGSCFTNQTWPFQISSNCSNENSKDNSVGCIEKVETLTESKRAFPLDKLTVGAHRTSRPPSPVGASSLPGKDNRCCQIEVGKSKLILHVDNLSTPVINHSAALEKLQKQIQQLDPPVNSYSEDCVPFPFPSLAADKRKEQSEKEMLAKLCNAEEKKTKSDESNSSEKDKNSNSSVSSTHSLSSKEDLNKEDPLRSSSPLPYITSMSYASNLILLGDEETTCTTFVSPSKPQNLPSEFYPPGVRAPVLEEVSYARHIRGPPQIIDMLTTSVSKLGQSSSGVACNDAAMECVTPLKDRRRITDRTVTHKKDQSMEKTKSVVKSCEPQIDLAKEDYLNSWKSFIEQKFNEIFHKELRAFKEVSSTKQSKAQLLEMKIDLMNRYKKYFPVHSKSSWVVPPNDRESPDSRTIPLEGDTNLKQTMASKGHRCQLENSVRYTDFCSEKSLDSQTLIDYDMVSDSCFQTDPSCKVHADEPDSTSDNQNKDVHQLGSLQYGDRDGHECEGESSKEGFLGETKLQEEESKENQSHRKFLHSKNTKPEESISSKSRPAKLDSVLSPDGHVHFVKTGKKVSKNLMNATLTHNDGETDGYVYEVNNALTPRGKQQVGAPDVYDSISMMEASLSEFDTDLGSSPNKGIRSSKPGLVFSPLTFKNKINPKHLSEKNSNVQVPPQEICTSNQDMTQDNTAVVHHKHKEAVQCYLDAIETESNSVALSNVAGEKEQCSRHKTFQELKNINLIKTNYVFVSGSCDESDLDTQHQEEDAEFVHKVKKVKKRLNLDFVCSPSFQSPIQVSDSLLSPPARLIPSETSLNSKNTEETMAVGKVVTARRNIEEAFPFQNTEENDPTFSKANHSHLKNPAILPKMKENIVVNQSLSGIKQTVAENQVISSNTKEHNVVKCPAILSNIKPAHDAVVNETFTISPQGSEDVEEGEIFDNSQEEKEEPKKHTDFSTQSKAIHRSIKIMDNARPAPPRRGSSGVIESNSKCAQPREMSSEIHLRSDRHASTSKEPRKRSNSKSQERTRTSKYHRNKVDTRSTTLDDLDCPWSAQRERNRGSRHGQEREKRSRERERDLREKIKYESKDRRRSSSREEKLHSSKGCIDLNHESLSTKSGSSSSYDRELKKAERKYPPDCNPHYRSTGSNSRRWEGSSRSPHKNHRTSHQGKDQMGVAKYTSSSSKASSRP